MSVFLPGGPFAAPPCNRCRARTDYFSQGLCSRCHPGMPAGSLTAQLDTGLVMARVSDSAYSASAAYPQSRFAHWSHRIRYRCSACHPDLFALAAGADTVSMADLRAGKSCGACHDGRAAFGLSACERCHVPPEAAGR